MAQLHRSCGEREAAAPLYIECLQLAHELEDQQSASLALLNLAILAIGAEDLATARAMLMQANEIARALDSRLTGQSVLAVVSGLAALRQDWRSAGRFSAAADAVSAHTMIQLDPSDKASLLPLWQRAESAFGSQAYESARASGAVLSYEQAMDEASDWLARAV